MPRFRSCRIPSAESSRSVSATAIRPSSRPSSSKSSGVFPCPASSTARLRMFSGRLSFPPMKARLPPRSFLPSAVPSTPFPGRARKPLTIPVSRCFSAASRTTALARGCSLCCSSAAALASSSASVIPSAGTRSVTFGSPEVIVPVLSSAMICAFPAVSSASPVLNRMPFFAPRPFPTMIATGVARPSAQGQEITSTEMPRATAKPASFPAIIQPRNTSRAIPMTAGTNTPDTRSAIRAIGALVAAASDTIRMIWLSVVSSPTRSARQVRKPDWLIVAALTRSPAALSTGTDSPVRAASFTALSPESTVPSTGILSPGRTVKRSPMRTSSTGTSVSCPSRRSVAVFGASFIRLFRAFVVFPLDRASSILPTVISAGIIAADSKYSRL